MIAGLDSSFSRPTPVIVARARAAGVGLWSGYIATKGGVNLASPWDLASFNIARQVGGTPIAFCSGWDDPAALRQLAAQWSVRLCLDVEAGIRPDGSWVQQWLDLSGAGLYGQHFQDTSGVWHSIHLNRTAAFHVMSWYIGRDPGANWAGPTPADGSPLGWQWEGDHQEFGLSVDRGTYADWFAGTFSGGSIGVQPMTDQEVTALFADWYVVYAGRWPAQSDLDYIAAHWLPAWRADPFKARFDFGTAAAGEAGGKNVAPVRHFEMDTAIAAIPPGPATYVKHTHGPTDTGTPA